MKGKITWFNKTELRAEILGRMSALDTQDEEFSNKDLISDFEDLLGKQIMNNNGIVNENLALSKEKRDLIFELSKNNLFKHSTFTATGKIRKLGGKSNYQQISKVVKVNKCTVRAYIKNLHNEFRKYLQKPGVKERRREYMQEPEVKQKQREYMKKPEVKKEKKKYLKKYYKNHREKIIESSKKHSKKYLQKPGVKERKIEYNHKYHKKYMQRPEIKERKRESCKEYYAKNRNKINENKRKLYKMKKEEKQKKDKCDKEDK